MKILRNSISVAILLLFLITPTISCGQSESANNQLISRETFFSPKDILAVKLSPKGNYLGYVSRKSSGNKLIIEKLKNGKRSGQTFSFPLSNRPGFWGFINDNQCIIGFPTQNGFKVHLGNYKTGECKEITPDFDGRVEFIKHKNHLVFSINATDEISSGFYTYNLQESKWKKIMPLNGFYQVYFTQNLEPIFGIRYRSGDVTFLRKPKNKDWQKVAFYKWPLSFPVDIVSVDENGIDVYLLENSKTDKTALVKLNTQTGLRTVMARSSLADINPEFNLVNPNTGRPEIVTSVYGNRKAHTINKNYKNDVKFLQNFNEGDVEFRGQSDDGNYWLVGYFDGSLTSYFLYDRKEQIRTFLFKDHSGLENYRPASRHFHEITARDGLKLPCLLFLPPDSDEDKDGFPDNPLPTIQMVHGGPWVGYYQFGWQLHRAIQLYANRGYAVMFTEFRGATGYGKDFVNRGNLQWGEAMHYDVIDVGKWLIKNKVAPKNKMAVAGVSYGAYASYMALVKQPDMYQCAITKYGPTDLVTTLQTSVASNEIWRTRVGNDQTEEGLALLKDHSPINAVVKITKPILMSHGSRDRMCPQSQSDAFADALNKAGKKFIYTIYPDEGHDYRNPDNNISYMAMAEKLLHECLGGKFEPLKNDLEKGNYILKCGKELLE